MTTTRSEGSTAGNGIQKHLPIEGVLGRRSGGGVATADGGASQMQVAMRRGICWHGSLQVRQRVSWPAPSRASTSKRVPRPA